MSILYIFFYVGGGNLGIRAEEKKRLLGTVLTKKDKRSKIKRVQNNITYMARNVQSIRGPQRSPERVGLQ